MEPKKPELRLIDVRIPGQNQGAIDFTIIYAMFGIRCVFMQLYPKEPLVTLHHTADIIDQISFEDGIASLPEDNLSFYNLVPLGKTDVGENVNLNVFEFCEITVDFGGSNNDGLSWWHVACPPEVLNLFGQYLTKNPEQTFRRIKSELPNEVYLW